MSPAQHTKGPWRVINAAPRADNTTAYLLAEHPWENSEANARLIAAAPELLAALEQALDVVEPHPHTRPTLKGARGDVLRKEWDDRKATAATIRAAIAKAKGGT